MMERHLIWAITFAFSILVLTIGGCETYTRHRIAKAIEAGVDPLSAKCALDRPDGAAILICAKVIK
jgi:hypothetical protein